MSDATSAVHLPPEIHSVKLGPNGLPLDSSVPMAPSVSPTDSSDPRLGFPAANLPSLPTVSAEATTSPLMAEIARAAADDGTQVDARIAGGYQAPAGAVPGSPPSGGSSGGQPSVPSVSGMADGGTGTSSADKRKPVVEFLNPAKMGVHHDLEDPLRVDGVEYRSAFIKSPEGARYGMFQQLAAEAGEDQFKLFTAMIWLISDLPLEVIEVLTIDDRDDILKVGSPFFSRRLRLGLRPYLRALAKMEEGALEPAEDSSSTEGNAE